MKPRDDYPEAALTDAPLRASGAGLADEATSDATPRQPPPSWCAQALIAPAREAGLRGLIYIASGERRADEIGRALRQFAPDLEVLTLPPWDCLPYDRASPSRECMGRRMAVLKRLSEPSTGPRVLVAGVEAFLQKVPPIAALEHAFLRLQPDKPVDREALQAFAKSTGYVFDDRIDEPGEIAILGAVVDLYPAASDAPVRISLGEDDRIIEIKRFDPRSQRTEDPLDAIVVGPASELILPPDAGDRPVGAEHRASETYGDMVRLWDLLPAAAIATDARTAIKATDFEAQVQEAHEARRSLPLSDAEPLLPPAGLYLPAQALQDVLTRRDGLELASAAITPIPIFARERNPGRAFSDFVQSALQDGQTVLLTGLSHELRPLARALKRGLDRAPEGLPDWGDLGSAKQGLYALQADIDAGFQDQATNLTVIAAADVLGGRIVARGQSASPSLDGDPDLRVGDVVIHEDHGLGVLKALQRIEVAGEKRDALRLEFHGGAELLAPIEEFGKIWRYGAEREAVTLDRLNTDAWSRRRVELSAEIDETADHLVRLARIRRETPGEVIKPPKAAYARLAARFPYPETPDQSAAIEAVLGDLASGQVMNRLVCGDVGFGKTEVALRAAMAAALGGKQVAIVAPTTVLARQHYESFRRRFSGADLTVGRLSRLVSASEAKAVKEGLADGSVRLVVATHALAAKDVAFADLGLLIIDEEQRFGAKLKAQLRALAPRAHLLTMTATPIPRTLQLAMVGLEDVSIIATPPARRRPIRTFLAPYDAATVKTALMREHRRGGQSFVVAPRIEDIAPLAESLRSLVPGLKVHVAHGQLPPEEVDEVMVAFAAGDGDVLLATNIIESGLDVPRANTMLVVRADLFGLAQLHQLRGRVGRGRTQGVAYLFHEADQELPDATRARLSTLEAFDRLGSGLAISTRDLELRGAGDLVGEEQAGHVKLIGTALYQRLLSRAVRVARGEIEGPDWTPELNIGVSGAFVEAYVPDANIRINLYARLARMAEIEEIQGFADELEDRFGPPTDEVQALLALARVRALAQKARVARIDAGPKGIAFTPQGQADLAKLAKRAGLEATDQRLICRSPAAEPMALVEQIERALGALAPR